MSEELNPNIEVVGTKSHMKASEEYCHVRFSYGEEKWDGWVPTEYRRTGLSLKDPNEVFAHLNRVYEEMRPEKREKWLQDQEPFWNEKKKAEVTKSFFDVLSDGAWKCVCCQLPSNPNWARRIQTLKDFGYTIATDTNRYCKHCHDKKTHLILLPITRCGVDGNGYESWSPKLRKRIVEVLGGVDVYDGVRSHCLPDHKFPEIRWDEYTKAENSEDMAETEIRGKFQLLTNQRNLQKREVCRSCFQSGKRGYPYGIKYYYSGGEEWNPDIPRKGKEAEQGCIGCGWYDVEVWRQSLMEALNIRSD